MPTFPSCRLTAVTARGPKSVWARVCGFQIQICKSPPFRERVLWAGLGSQQESEWEGGEQRCKWSHLVEQYGGLSSRLHLPLVTCPWKGFF